MQQLHLVGFTTDSDHLILSAKKGAKSGSFVVPLDEQLLDVIAAAVRRRNADAGEDVLHAPPELVPVERTPTKRSSLLSPREIQARLRAGRTPSQVASEADADEEWIIKFAPPVLAERARVVASARELVYTRPRRGESAEPLGLSVRWNLADRGVRLLDDEFDACWSAFNVGGLAWGVVFEITIRGRRQRAEWEVDLGEGEVVARNRIAADLGYVEPGKRRRIASLVPDPQEVRKRPRAALDEGDEPPAKSTSRSPARSTTKKAGGSRRVAPATARGTKSVKAAAKVTKAAKRSGPTSATKNAATKKVGTKKAVKAARASKVAKAGRTAKSSRSARAAKTSGAAKRATSGPGRQAAPPEAPSVVPAPAPKPPVNELDRRRLEMVGRQRDAAAAGSPRGAARPAGRGVTTPAAAPAARSAPQRTPPSPPAHASAPLSFPSASDSASASAALRRTNASSEAEPETQEPTSHGGAAPDDAEARARREARRRARAERAAAAEVAEVAASPARPGARVAPVDTEERPRPAVRPLPDDTAIPIDEGRVVTIRANQAGGSDVVVPGGVRPLRPAQPAAQPKRRRFGRKP
ncbi:MAG TPA: septation protein SepH [Acidimicrobiales bacterium]|nr:septation protein SepH [Acidimicrobiales bacterium]